MYRGADLVLGWSFYSQGTKERLISADEFIAWALEQLSVRTLATNSIGKAEALAEAFRSRRILILLDGIETMQFGPGVREGYLKDQGLRIFLRRVAAFPPDPKGGLVVLTTRLTVRDLDIWQDSAAPIEELKNISLIAGCQLLRDNGVNGGDESLEAAVIDFDGHALALTLLANYLRELHHGDIRQRDRIRGLLDDPDAPGHDHARRVMESYERDWLSTERPLLAIMFLISLFDRPAHPSLLRALRRQPEIRGLTTDIAKLSERAWRRHLARLRRVGLLSPEEKTNPDSVDAHALVREWFAIRLKENAPSAWKAAHSRVYEELRRTSEGSHPTLQSLAPLYQAITHGCQAGRHSEVLRKIFQLRIHRLAAYSWKVLGGAASDLVALSWFYSEPYSTVASELDESSQAWVFSATGLMLRSQGRLSESIEAHQRGLDMEEKLASELVYKGLPTVEFSKGEFRVRKDRHVMWQNAAISASNLSEVQLIAGQVVAAVVSGEVSVLYAQRAHSKDYHVIHLTTLGEALFAKAEIEEAEKKFREAERLLGDSLGSLQGYRYMDFLLERADWEQVTKISSRMLQQSKLPQDVAVAMLAIARARMGNLASNTEGPDAKLLFEDVEKMLSGALENFYADAFMDRIALGFLVRSRFHRLCGEWGSALSDLAEAEELANSGPMRLHLVEIATERARVMLAQLEGNAPLRHLLPEEKRNIQSGGETTELKSAATRNLGIAHDIISETGYMRRNRDVTVLTTVANGHLNYYNVPNRV